MQGRASKTPKKELVIESPQQYKRLVAAEPEVDPVPQVVVSHSSNSHRDVRLFGLHLKKKRKKKKSVLTSQICSDP